MCSHSPPLFRISLLSLLQHDHDHSMPAVEMWSSTLDDRQSLGFPRMPPFGGPASGKGGHSSSLFRGREACEWILPRNSRVRAWWRCTCAARDVERGRIGAYGTLHAPGSDHVAFDPSEGTVRGTGSPRSAAASRSFQRSPRPVGGRGSVLVLCCSQHRHQHIPGPMWRLQSAAGGHPLLQTLGQYEVCADPAEGRSCRGIPRTPPIHAQGPSSSMRMH